MATSCARKQSTQTGGNISRRISLLAPSCARKQSRQTGGRISRRGFPSAPSCARRQSPQASGKITRRKSLFRRPLAPEGNHHKQAANKTSRRNCVLRRMSAATAFCRQKAPRRQVLVDVCFCFKVFCALCALWTARCVSNRENTISNPVEGGLTSRSDVATTIPSFLATSCARKQSPQTGGKI